MLQRSEHAIFDRSGEGNILLYEQKKTFFTEPSYLRNIFDLKIIPMMFRQQLNIFVSARQNTTRKGRLAYDPTLLTFRLQFAN